MTKRILSLFIAFVLLISVIGIQTEKSVSAGVDGIPDILEYSSNTSANSYVISSYAGMVAFSALASTTNFKDKTISLACDIDMSVGEYTPFSSFSGTFDGKGFALKNININVIEGLGGIFAKTTATATVKNLGVVGGKIKVTASTDSHRVGSFIGQMSGGTIERCYSTAELSAVKLNSSVTDDLSVGGIVGANINGGVVKNCMFAGTATGISHASGISDWGQGHYEGYVGTIINCLNIGKLNASTCYGIARYSSSILEANKATAVTNSYYIGNYKDIDFTTQDIKTENYKIGSGELAYLLNQSGKNKIWHQGELCPELTGASATGVYKLTIKYVCNGVSTAQTVYMNAGDKYSTSDAVNATLESSGNVTDNVFTMPASNATLTITTNIPNIVNYSTNTSAKNFVITNSEGFTALAVQVNSGKTMAGVSIYMLGNIDMSSVSNHTPIGVFISNSDYSTSFQGSFHGNGYKVINLKVNQTSLNGAGLFGISYNATFSDLGICGGSITSANRAGAISGYADACTFASCYNTADVTTTTGTDGTGGLTGVSRTTCKFTNCFNMGTITAKADSAGGISGWGQTNAVFKNCFNMGKISASDANAISRHGDSLTPPPVSCYYIDSSADCLYGSAKSLGQFTDGSVTWLLNTNDGSTENTGYFTTTPMGPALCSVNSYPTFKVTVKAIDDDSRILDIRTAYANAGGKVGAGNANDFYLRTVATVNTEDTEAAVTVVPVSFKTHVINTAAELSSFAASVNNGNAYKNCYVCLNSDINMSGVTATAIGSPSSPFMGIFDGKGHIISNFKLSSSAKFQGLFGFVKGGVVQNLRLEGASITGGNYSGTIVGNNEGGAVYCCGTDATATGYYSAASQELSIMSFNIRVPNDASPNSLSDRTPRVKQHLNTYNPDIIGFQEVTSAWKSVLDSHLSGYSKEFVWRDSQSSSEAAPLYWKTSKFTVLEQGSFWLSSTPDKMSIDWDAGCYRTCSYAALVHKSSGALVLAFNTHFDHQSSAARSNSALLLTKRMRAMQEKYTKLGYGNNIATFCTGDYNCKPTTTAYANMIAEFSDSRAVADSLGCDASQTTFNGWGDSASIIDYIFTDTRGANTLTFKVCAEKVNGGYISDHYTLYSTIGLEAQCLGGIVGINSGVVSDCYTLGTVTKSLNAGGVVGYNLGMVQNSFSGKLINATDHMGGVIGVERGITGNCYYLTSTTYNSNADFITTVGNKTTAQLMSSATADSLNKGGSLWGYNSSLNGGYPYQTTMFELVKLVIKATSSYNRNKTFLHMINTSTSVSNLCANFDNTNLAVYDFNGNPLDDASIVGTGAKISVVAGGVETDSVTVVIKGDLSGDGVITSVDYVLIMKHIKATSELSGAFALACDIDGDLTTSAADYIAMRAKIKDN